MRVAEAAPEAQTGVFYFQNDHLGTPKRLLNKAGGVVWQARHAAFGFAEVVVEEVVNNLRYPGQYYDAESGLHHNFYRDYDSLLGRYIQADPIGLEGGVDQFSYAESSPFSLFDAFSLKSVALYDFLPAGGFVDGIGGDTAATIICDGNGNIVPYVVPEMYEEFNSCITDCMSEHEMGHVNQANENSPGTCKDVVKNTVVVFSRAAANSNDAKEYELEAYRVERDCLLKKRSEECSSDECKDEIDDRLHDTVYRNIQELGGSKSPPRRPRRVPLTAPPSYF